MSDVKKSPDEKPYDQLFKELGEELDLDVPIGSGASLDSETAETPMFETVDAAEAQDKVEEASSAEPSVGGVELSAQLMDELRSVMGGSGPSDDVGDVELSEGDVFASSDVDTGEMLDSVIRDVLGEEGVRKNASTFAEDPLILEEGDGDVEADEDDTEAEAIFDPELDAEAVLKEAMEEREKEEMASREAASVSEPEPTFDLDAELAKVSDEMEGDDANERRSLVEVLTSNMGLDLDPEQVEESESDIAGDAEEFDAEEDVDADLAHASTEDEEHRLDDQVIDELSPVAVPADDIAAPPIDMDLAEEEPEIVFSYANGDGAGDRLVPRISIHAFCETERVTRLLTTARNDRRMANVSMEVHQGGVAAAYNYYSERSTPHLLVVESTAKAAELLSNLDSLAERCDETVKVIIIGATNDIRLFRELMHRGVSEYVVPPIDTVQLIRTIANLFVDPEQPFVGKTISVTGVKGGVGSSTIAHNLAWAVSNRLELNATLVDLDLNFGTTGLDFNEESQQTIADAIVSPDRFDEAVLERLLVKVSERLSLFTAPATLDRTYDLDTSTFDTIINQVRQSVPFVIMDLPHIWSDWFKDAIVASDDIVVVVQPDLASLRNGKNLIDFLKAARSNDSPPRLVINNVGMPKRPEIPVKDFGAAIGIEPELILPFDPQLFGTAANNGQMISDVAPESKCSQGLDYLAGVLTGREVVAERGGTIIDKLFKR